MPLSLLRKLAARRPTAPRARPACSRLSLVPLEDRIVPSTLYVDDDRQQNSQARYTSIQAAVRQARPGDTIQVSPGLYNEVVTVDKAGLKLLGDQVNYLERTGATTPENRTREVVVTAVKASPLGIINLRANGVVLQGFTIQNNTTGPGVFTDPQYSGYLIKGNLIRGNSDGGLHLNSSGVAQTLVRENAIKGHTDEFLGDGLYTELTVRNARIEGNYFEGNVHYSMDFAGDASAPGYPGFRKFYPRSADVIVTNNTIENSGGVLVQYADRIVVSNNTITQATRTGVYVGGDVDGVTVSNNTLTNAAIVAGFGKHTGIFVGTLDEPGSILAAR